MPKESSSESSTDLDFRVNQQVACLQHEDMWERAMKSYKWVHHLPQVRQKNSYSVVYRREDTTYFAVRFKKHCNKALDTAAVFAAGSADSS